MDLLGKCRQEGEIQRGAGILLIVLSVLGGGSDTNSLLAQPTGSILPPDAAARAFTAGRDAVRRGDHAEGIRKLLEALATGHVKAADRLGTGRYPVEHYDPNYWLGVAYMETGDETMARRHLERSRDDGAVLRWGEASDLRLRLESLDRRRAAREAAAATTATRALPPSPTAVPPPPSPATPTPSPPPTPPAPSPSPTPPPDRPAVAGPPEPTAVPGSRHLVEAVVGALAAGDFPRAQVELDELRRKEPGAIEVDLLEAVLLGSRYLLDGRRDEVILARARRALQSFRRRGGSRKAEEVWMSPALAAVLGAS